MIWPKDFRSAWQLFTQCRPIERPMLLLVLTGQVMALVGLLFSKILWIDRGLLIFLAGFVLLMANFFLTKQGEDKSRLHLRMIAAVFLTIIFATLLGAFVGLVALAYGLFQGFDAKMLPVSLRFVGVFGIMGFVSTLLREWKPLGAGEDVGKKI